MEKKHATAFRSILEPLAPVVGGGWWRSACHDIADACRKAGGFTLPGPEYAMPPTPCVPEAVTHPIIPSKPPTEAREGEEYAYQARAYSADTTGFFWYFEKCAPGMAVDKHTGKVTWIPDEGGWFDIVLCARSLYGAASKQCWTVCVRKAARTREAVPNPRYIAAALRKRLRATLWILFVLFEKRRRDELCRRTIAPPEERPRAALPLRV